MGLVHEAFKERGREPRFADTGFAGKQHHLAFGIICPRPASQQYFGLFFPANERGQAGRVQILMGLRIAEVYEDAITQIFRNEPTKAAHDLGEMTSRKSSGSIRVESAVEPTRSLNM